MNKNLIVTIFTILVCAGADVHSQSHSSRLSTGWQYLKGDLGGIWEAVRSTSAGNPESVPSWQNVTLPHCFNAEDGVDPDKNYYQGPGWYRTNLKIDNPHTLGRTLLHFEGAGQKTEVYVYTTKVGSHVGGYDEWTVDITEAVDEFRKRDVFQKQFNGSIPIAIRCDNSRDLEMIPSALSDFSLYGGIYRYLNLVYVPALSIEKVLASSRVTANGAQASLELKTSFYNPGAVRDGQVEIRISDARGKIIDQFSSSHNIAGDHVWKTVVKKPALWSPSQPTLYTIEVKVTSSSGTHVHREKTGFRTAEFLEHGPFHLNGKRLLLRGTHRHEDHAGTGNAMTAPMIRREMIMMKQMGVNFIRLGHYQQSRIVLELCDSLGILVWEEIPWCRGGLGGDTYKEQAQRMLTNMITQHYNHPAVIIWGLGNENDWPGDFPEFDKEKIRAFMKVLNDQAHTLDPSRKTAIRRCDFCKDIVDVYSPSIWAGWYRGRYTEYRDVSEQEFKKVNHFLHVEWGGDSHARRHAEDPENALASIRTGNGADERTGDASLQGGVARFSKDGDWSETYICNLIDWHLKEQETMPWLTGTAYWPFKDFSTPVRPENPVPFVNQKGVVERDFTTKESYYVFQSYWADKPMVHLYGHSWPVRWGSPGELKMVKVYSNADEVELFVNGKSFGVKKRDSQDFPAAGLRWMVALAEGNNQLRAVARKGTVKIEDEITQRYQTAKWSTPARLSIEKIAEENDTVTLEAKILDDRNVSCLDARQWISFSLSGDGDLIDNQGTSTGARKVQAYNGRAIIRVNTNRGKSVVSVQSPGLPTAFFNLDKKPITP
jgi:beta-galactosidase